MIAAEAARGLAAFAGDPQGFITACRRMVQHQPGSAPLVWMCARAVHAPDPRAEIRAALDELDADRTSAELAFALPDDARVVVLGWPDQVGAALPRRGDLEVMVVDIHREGGALVSALVDVDVDAHDVPLAGLGSVVAGADLVLLEAAAMSPTEFLGISGSLAAASVAKVHGVAVWVAAGVGRMLPQRMWEPLRDRVLTDEPWDADDEVVPLELVDRVCGPTGPLEVDDAIRRIDCPIATELFIGDVL